MLEEIRIRGLGVIDDAVLELAPGLTVVTGETGAGKTMVVTGLGLLFGGRADSGVVRVGVERGAGRGTAAGGRRRPRDRSGRSRPAPSSTTARCCSLARSVSAEGRSRAYVGGRAVPVVAARRAGRDHVAVHGQSDQSRLLRPTRQREALDRYAGRRPSPTPLGAYAEAYAELRALDAELGELTTRSRERAQEADLLRFGLDGDRGGRPAARRGRRRSPPRKTGWPTPTTLRAAPPAAHDALLGAGEDPRAPTRPRWSAAAQASLGRGGRPRPGAGRARRPAERDRLPARPTWPATSRPTPPASTSTRPGSPRSGTGAPR